MILRSTAKYGDARCSIHCSWPTRHAPPRGFHGFTLHNKKPARRCILRWDAPERYRAPTEPTIRHSSLSRHRPHSHHAVGMRHCPRSEECKGINTSFPRNAFDSFIFFDGWAVGPCEPGKMSKVLGTFRDSKGINTAKKRRAN